MPRIDSKRTLVRRIESIRGGAAQSPTDLLSDPRALTRARWVLLGVFALNGVMMSSWLARIPSVRDALGLTPADLGVVLLAGAVGALATVTAAGPFVTRFGGRVAFAVSAVLFGVAFLLLGLGPATGSVPLLAAGIFVNGMAFSLGNVPMNVESAGIERRVGRTILPQFHAAFSIGAVIGSLVGAACAHAQVPVLVQFVATGTVAMVWRLAAIPATVHDTLPTRAPADAPAPVEALGDAVVDVETAGLRARLARRGARLGAALSAWREPRTLLIGLVILSAALSEGSANDWLSLAVVDGFAQTEAVGAVVFGTFVAAMTVMRLAGTRLIDRFGRVTVLRASGVASIAGLLLFGFAPTLPLAGVGVVLWGFGAALAVPVGIAAASDEPLRAASRVSVVSAFASMASLAAPPLLGLAAEAMGARHALVLIVAAMVLSVLLARQVTPLRTPAARTARTSRPGTDTDDGVPSGVEDGPEADAAVAADAADRTGDPDRDDAAGAVPDEADDARRPRWSRRPRATARTGSSTVHRASARRPRTRPSHRREETSA
ncbi:MFS family permease [Cellulosimicrobium cellulans]|uniref:MFS transporter n=1 Tax=Cellulosimicrobium cellulans TaxID=1710 RepID=UPI00195C4D8B|nr:MFS transporter [Cellulosimicrobium cellulans]MBM7818897.1 MFS family permease [Cellulosimicrobium cellulans]